MSIPDYCQQIVSKYFTNYKDYNNLFSEIQHINELYRTTFNYLFLDPFFIPSKNEIKYFINLINHQFPNAETIELNFNIYRIIPIEVIGNIIEIYKLFKKSDPKHKFKINIYKNVSQLYSKYELNESDLKNEIYISISRLNFKQIIILDKLNELIKSEVFNITYSSINILRSLFDSITITDEGIISVLLKYPYKIICYIEHPISDKGSLQNIKSKFLNNKQIYYTYDDILTNYNITLLSNLEDEHKYILSHSLNYCLHWHIISIRLLKDNVLSLLKEDKNEYAYTKSHDRYKSYHVIEENAYNNIKYIKPNNYININRYNHMIQFTRHKYIDNYIELSISLKSKFEFYKYYNINLINLLNQTNSKNLLP